MAPPHEDPAAHGASANGAPAAAHGAGAGGGDAHNSTVKQASEVLAKEMGFLHGFHEDRNRLNRRTMEDAHHVETNFANVHGQGFFAVYDGHAGRQAARWCGENLHKILAKMLDENPEGDVPELLNAAFEQADRDLDTKNIRAGCTAVVTVLKVEGDRRVLFTANVGDARAVLCRKGQAIRLTYDHKGSDPFEAKRIVDAGGFITNNRVNGVLAVTRSLGDASMKGLVVGNPYTTELDLSVDDEFLILACDGVWDVISDQEAVNLLLGVPDTQRAAELLVHQALQNMSTDNLSAIVVRFVHPKRRPSRATSEEIVFDDDETPTPRSAKAGYRGGIARGGSAADLEEAAEPADRIEEEAEAEKEKEEEKAEKGRRSGTAREQEDDDEDDGAKGASATAAKAKKSKTRQKASGKAGD